MSTFIPSNFLALTQQYPNTTAHMFAELLAFEQERFRQWYTVYSWAESPSSTSRADIWTELHKWTLIYAQWKLMIGNAEHELFRGACDILFNAVTIIWTYMANEQNPGSNITIEEHGYLLQLQWYLGKMCL